jgi:predicted  nucleic acid-binding Zn-ribbon protein
LKDELANRPKDTEVDALKQQIADLQVELAKRPQQREVDALKQQIAELEADVARLKDELANRPKDTEVDALKQQIVDLQVELAKRPQQREVDALKQQIAALEADVSRLKQELAKRPQQSEVDALKQQIAALEAQVNRLKREKEELQKRLTKTQDVISTTRQNEEHLHQRYDYLVDEHEYLENQLRQLQEDLKKAVGENTKNFRGLRDKIAQSVQEQIAIAKLEEHATKGEFPAIREAVWSHAKGEKKRYSPAAVFLILESMGGTWMLWLENEKRKDEPSKQDVYKEQKTLLLRQIVYHLTMWRSIANAPKRTRYMSKYVALFIDKHKLVNQDDPDPAAPASSDDDEPATPSMLDIMNAQLAKQSEQQEATAAANPANTVPLSSVPLPAKPLQPNDATQEPPSGGAVTAAVVFADEQEEGQKTAKTVHVPLP